MAAPIDGRRPVVHVLIAVKHLAHAKSRLATLLAATDRRQLVLAMLTDTILAAKSAPEVSALTVVTPDVDVADAARRAGASVFADPHPGTEYSDNPQSALASTSSEAGLNAALTAASDSALHVDSSATIIALQADLPALRPGELSAAIAAARQFRRAIVVDRHGTGTAALIVTGSDVTPTASSPTRPHLDPQFGADSANRHVACGAIALKGTWPGLRTDVDTAEDIRAVAELGVGPHTRALLPSTTNALKSHSEKPQH
ncbi:MAG: 2-phospho-L-lactate guanylyltransferase [Rhodococcus sp.]|nr:2-phospho-L-lactate guanylyltransferase [Rhodococcus sp. (in: high G+C Gram-positive bacteria)]